MFACFGPLSGYIYVICFVQLKRSSPTVCYSVHVDFSLSVYIHAQFVNTIVGCQLIFCSHIDIDLDSHSFMFLLLVWGGGVDRDYCQGRDESPP